MAKISTDAVFKTKPAKSETTMDKTSRIVKTMIDDEAEKRQAKNDRLRKARLEREAHTPAEPVAVARKARTPKAVAE